MMKKLLVAMLLAPMLAFAWTPEKPIEGLIGFSAGSINDLAFRALSAEVEKNTGAKFVTLNRVGAGGVIATEELSKRPADGYTVSVVSVPGLAAMDKVQVPSGNGRTYTTDSFIYPIHIASSPFVIASNTKNPNTTPAKFIQSLKTEKVSVAASGGARLVYEAIQVRVKFPQGNDSVVRVDHKGPNDALLDVMNGSVTYAVVPAVVANALYKDQKINIIALSGPPPLRQLPGVPLLSEALPGFDVNATWGLMIPANTPDDIVQWYTREFSKAVESETVKSMFYDNLLLERKDLRNPVAFKNWIKAREKEWQPLVDTVLNTLNK